MWVVWLRGKKRAAMVEWQPLADHSYEDLQVRLFILLFFLHRIPQAVSA
jgi:hypothetical protein